MDEKVIQHMALLMSVNCVRKTVLDDYVVAEKLSEQELQSFIGESTDKIYTFLTYLLNRSEEDKQAFLQVMSDSYPSDWQTPQVSAVFEEAVNTLKAQQGSK